MLGAGTGAKASTWLSLKLAVAGAGALVIAGGAATMLHWHKGSTEPRGWSGATSATTAMNPAPPAVVPPIPSAATGAELAMAPASASPTATAELPSRGAASATARSMAPGESVLARELRSLDDARSALSRGDAAAALSALDRHDRAFPAGALREEADVLRVDALVAHGDRAAARRLAEDILRRDPAGPHTRRLQTIADGPR